MPKEKSKNKENKNFFKEFKAELKRVIWPTPKQLMNSTIAVIVIVIAVATIVFGLDFVFDKANNFGIEKLKTVLKNSEEVVDTTVDEIIDDITLEETDTLVEEDLEN